MTLVIEIRDTVFSDLDAIAKMHLPSWRFAYKDQIPDKILKEQKVSSSRRIWRPILKDASCRTLVACLDQEIVGVCAVGASNGMEASVGETTGEIYSIYVAPHLLQTGIGRMLIDAHLDDTPFCTLFAWVVKGNVYGEAFFQKLNFRPDPKTEKDFSFKHIHLKIICYRLDVLTN